MSPAADRPRAVRRTMATALVVALLASLLVVTSQPQPVLALHQHCGDDLTPEMFSQTNGHPLAGSRNPGWGGQEVLQDYAITMQALGFARSVISDVVDSLDATADLVEAVKNIGVGPGLFAGTPVSQVYAATVYLPGRISESVLRGVILGFLVTNLVLSITETAVGAVQLNLTIDVEDEDACGGTLAGDTLTSLWVARVQQHLAGDGPPVALLMTPSALGGEPDWPLLPRAGAEAFPWCPEIPAEVRGQLPAAGPVALSDTGGNCSPIIQTGLLDAPSLGVKDIVANTIGHLVAHGVDVRSAEVLLAEGDAALEAGRFSDAYHLYRQAYRLAVEVPAS